MKKIFALFTAASILCIPFTVCAMSKLPKYYDTVTQIGTDEVSRDVVLRNVVNSATDTNVKAGVTFPDDSVPKTENITGLKDLIKSKAGR